MTPTLRFGLVGPDQTQPCGIADYTARLADALRGKCELAFVPYREALNATNGKGLALDRCQAILVQYERSLVPDQGFLKRLSKRFPGRVFVVPHEVYKDDPFAFPYAEIRSQFPLILQLKRLVYRWRHREYEREKKLQRCAYAAEGVLPLSGPGFDILKAMAGSKILELVPLAFFSPSRQISSQMAITRETIFPTGTGMLIGIFGFLNPGLDYALIFELLKRLNQNVCLLLVGGPRPGGTSTPDLESEAAAQGLAGRVRTTGYLTEENLYAHLRLCDLFICPMRFKSNSSSLLNLIPLAKPILASDLPLTRYLQSAGVPLELYSDVRELAGLVQGFIKGELKAKPNRYPWDFDLAADTYLKVLAGAIRS